MWCDAKLSNVLKKKKSSVCLCSSYFKYFFCNLWFQTVSAQSWTLFLINFIKAVLISLLTVNVFKHLCFLITFLFLNLCGFRTLDCWLGEKFDFMLSFPFCISKMHSKAGKCLKCPFYVSSFYKICCGQLLLVFLFMNNSSKVFLNCFYL